MSKLILTADDYGLNQWVNEATINSVKNRTVTSVQVLMNMASEEDVLTLANAIHEAGNLCGIGLHFCTTVGPSLVQKPTSFVELDTDGIYHFIDLNRWKHDPNADSDMLEELTAQFEKLKGIIGSERIDSFSSHQNIHMFNPNYMQMLGSLAEENWIPVRSPLRWTQDQTKSYPDGLVMQPIEDHAIKTVTNCIHQTTRRMLYNGIFPEKMKICRALINDNKKTGGTPHTMTGHWYGQPKKRALNWIVQILEEMASDRPHYATEVLMHLSTSAAGDLTSQIYLMKHRLKEYNVLNTIDVKDFINSLYTREKFELGSYRKTLLGENINYDLSTPE